MDKSAYNSLTTREISEEEAVPYEEAYFGQLPEFAEMDKQFESLIKRARKEGVTKCNPNKYKENETIQKLFEKVFGFKNVYIYWVPTNDIEGCTVVPNLLLLFGESKEYIEMRPGRGFYDSSNSTICFVELSTGLLKESFELTAREFVAVILHEIGHNFDYSNFHIIDYFMYCCETLGAVKSYVKYNMSIQDRNREIMNEYEDTRDASEEIYNNQKKRDEYAKKFEDDIEKAANRENGELAKKVLVKQLKKSLAFLIKPLLHLINMGAHKGEQFADSFPTAYGYGLELGTSLEKMDRNYLPNRKNPTKSNIIMDDLYQLKSEQLQIAIGECHGTDQERIKMVIKKLKRDLRRKDYPDGMKKEVEKEIAKVERFYNTVVHAQPDDKLRLTKMYRTFVDVFFGGIPNITKFFKRNQI